MRITVTASTHTFLFADIVAFTTIAEREGDVRAAELALTLADVTAAVVHDMGGEFVKSIGDAVMVRSPSARLGLDLALRLQWDLAAVDGFPGIHAGLHSGPAVHAADDWYGHTVNVAARLSAAAAPGEILCTDATLADAGELTDVRVTGAGERLLKNAGARITVYRLDRALERRGAVLRLLPAMA